MVKELMLMFSPMIRNKTKMSTLTSLLNILLEVPATNTIEIRGYLISLSIKRYLKGRNKTTFIHRTHGCFSENFQTIYYKASRTNKCIFKVMGYRCYKQKSIAFLYIDNEQLELKF